MVKMCLLVYEPSIIRTNSHSPEYVQITGIILHIFTNTRNWGVSILRAKKILTIRTFKNFPEFVLFLLVRNLVKIDPEFKLFPVEAKGVLCFLIQYIKYIQHFSHHP